MIFLMYISFLFLILSEILDEVINGDLHDTKSHIKTAIIFGTSQVFGLIAGYGFGIVIYGLIRLAVFDLVYAKLFKNDWFYLGTTSKWDKFISNIPLSVIMSLRALSLLISIYLVNL